MTAHRLPLLLVVPMALFLLGASVWCLMALWFRMPGPDMLRWTAMAVFAFLNLAAFMALLNTRHLRPFLVFLVLYALVLGWWSTLRPPTVADWAPDVAQQVTGTFDGDLVTLTGVRDFEWTGPYEAQDNWVTRTYDLSQLESLDLILSYWGDPKMAHFILSFGFAGGEQLAWSVEVRRTVNGGFSPIADMFRANPLSIIAATERDVVGVRTNYRGEDVLLLRLTTDPFSTRDLFEEYVIDANKLAAKPAWYNSIKTNCTTVVFNMFDAVGRRIDFDWRIIANGYLPEYVYDEGVVVTDIPVSELREQSRISAKAKAFGLGDGFSQAIREGLPEPVRRTEPK